MVKSDEGGAYEEGRYGCDVELPEEEPTSELPITNTWTGWDKEQQVKRQVAELRRRRAAKRKA